MRELDRRGIVTKERQTRNPRYDGGIPFRYGALAYLLKNRIGEVHHGDKWFPGEHEPLLDRTLFEEVQEMIASHAVRRRNGRSASGALLAGLIYDARGNRMSPSFTLKDGVRYRFYVSTALLQGRKAECGTIGRIKAATIEKLVLTALHHRQPAQPPTTNDPSSPAASQAADATAPAGDAAPTACRAQSRRGGRSHRHHCHRDQDLAQGRGATRLGRLRRLYRGGASRYHHSLDNRRNYARAKSGRWPYEKKRTNGGVWR